MPLAPEADLSARQWTLIELELANAAQRIVRPVRVVAVDDLADAARPEVRRRMARRLGSAEIELARAYSFFDTLMDVLTQRLSPELGPLLKGCDALALDALSGRHSALDAVEAPVVNCDRGFGASVLREGVPTPAGGVNPLPLIQIPYARLQEKHTLTSVLHEVGHEVQVRLKLRLPLARAVADALARAGAPRQVQSQFAGWVSEIFPDFWAFCATGMAHAATMRDILALPPSQVTRIQPGEPHPVPFVRALLGFDWCRHAFGAGPWDEWERDWRIAYPLERRRSASRALLSACADAIPVVTRVLFVQSFPNLGVGSIPRLFDLEAVSPARLASVLQGRSTCSPEFLRLRPCVQLAAFSLLRERSLVPDAALARAMTTWLRELPRRSN
ncbi:hypothetical protein WME75_10925 [Sorangium sp. So ce1014]|uniref:hypothetical protein n=1 Tax=Sorangium sp. So ce1014 TaxID=3133326 RepID=UPI003F5E0583